MNNKKPAHIRFSYFNNEKTEQKLSNMAAQGWILTADGGRLCYRNGTPQRLHYSIVPSPNLNQDARELDELCAAAGWELVAVKKRFRIYVNAQEDPVPIYTDPQDSMDRYGRFVRRRILITGAVDILLYLAIILLQGMIDNPFSQIATLMAVPLNYIQIVLLGVFILLFFCYLAAMLIPLYVGKTAVGKRENWQRTTRRVEKSTHWVQVAGTVIPLLLFAGVFTDQLTAPLEWNKPPLTGMEQGAEGELCYGNLQWEDPYSRFYRYVSRVESGYGPWTETLGYVYIESELDLVNKTVDRLWQETIEEVGHVYDERFSTDQLKVYHSGSYLLIREENQVLYAHWRDASISQDEERLSLMIEKFYQMANGEV